MGMGVFVGEELKKKTNKLKDHVGQLLLKVYQVVINTSKPRLPGSIIDGDSC